MKLHLLAMLAAAALAIPSQAASPDQQRKPSREQLVGRWAPASGDCSRWIELGADGKFKTTGDFEGDWSLKDGFLVALDMAYQQYVLGGQVTLIDANTIEVADSGRLKRCV